MIESRKENQEAARNIIKRFAAESTLPVPYPVLVDNLTAFLKYFSEHIMPRVDEDDCYFIDMLEDFQRLGEE